MAADLSVEDVRPVLSWMDCVEIVGDGTYGPYYVLRDGTVVTIEVPWTGLSEGGTLLGV